MNGKFHDNFSIFLKDELCKFNRKKTPTPPILHFIWIGDDYEKKMSYVDVWEKNNLDKTVQRWIDINTSACKILDKALKKYSLKKTKSTSEFDIFLNEIRNSAFLYVWDALSDKNNFNILVESFLTKNSIDYDIEEFKLKTQTCKSERYFDINELFNGDFKEYRRLYYFELILRCNLACASDLIRLLILQKYGGVYIDVDTLPYIDNNFPQTNRFLKDQDLVCNEGINLAKSYVFLASNENETLDLDQIKVFLTAGLVSDNNIIRISDLLLEDFKKNTKMTATPLTENLVTKDSLLLSSIHCNDDIFYNNVICAHPNSRIIKFLLLRIKRMYNFLENSGIIFSTEIFHEEPELSNENIEVFKYYRRDFIFRDEYVTKHLTGPTFIVKVIFGILSRFYRVNSVKGLKEIFEALKNPTYGISFIYQNLDTPAGILSSWREDHNG